jgi:hypothetical protein
MKKILITIFGFLSIISVAHASILGVQSGGTGASTLTGCLTGNGIQPITGTGSACGSGGGTGSSTPLIASTELWIDGNATTTTQSGSIQYPFHTIDAANAYVTASSGILASGATYHIAPANYVELNSTLTMPNTALMIFAGKSTIITGYGAANGTINFPNQFSWNGGTILGSVTETDTSTSTPHSFEDDFAILGNINCSGLCTLLNGVQLSFASTTAGYAPIGATSTLTIGRGALANILGENTVASVVDNGGTLNLNDDQVICTTSSYCITATTTGSIVEVLGLTLINPSGGGINVQNGATITPNNLGNIIITDGVGATPIISNATTTTILNGYNAYSVIGQQQYAAGSGYIASDQIGLFTDGGSVLGSNVGGIPIGTTTIDDPFVASSTFAETNTATSTFAGGISATCFSTGSGCITGTGGTNYFTNSSASTTLNTGTILIAPTGSFGVINATTTATSTFKGGISANCFSINGGICLSSGSGSGTIGGSITSGQIAFGSTTANAIKGTANATLDLSGDALFNGNVQTNRNIVTNYVTSPSDSDEYIKYYENSITNEIDIGDLGCIYGCNYLSMNDSGILSDQFSSFTLGNANLILGGGASTANGYININNSGGQASTFTVDTAGDLEIAPYTLKLGINQASPTTALDVNGDITDENVKNAGCLATNSTGKIIASTTCSGGSGGSQTPWTSNINGAGYNLTNVANISTVGSVTVGSSGTLGTVNISSSAIGNTNGLIIQNGAVSGDTQFQSWISGGWKNTMTLKAASYNVGIATTTPATTLDVNGNVTIEKANGIIMRDTVTGSCYIIKVTSGVLVPTASTTAAC